ncbi:ATP-binding protein [uncultured Jatrophihabitans sp.]|uniref:ATP-binding protein n=1 Tax=uncultured Jatrophihabitans sp. TaxID=1610747 RepID=UPI0035CA9BAC
MRRLRRLNTVRTRIALTVAVAVLGSTIAATLVAYHVESNDTRDLFRYQAIGDSQADVARANELAGAEATNAAAVTSIRTFLAQRRLDRNLNLNVDLAGYAILAPDVAETSVCLKTRCRFPVPSLVRNAVGERDIDGFFWADGRRLLVVADSIDRTSTQHLMLVGYYRYSDSEGQLPRLRNYLLWIDAGGLVAAVLLGLAVAVGISRPVRRTARAAHQFGAGDLDTRIPVRGSGDLAELAQNFNAMAQRLSDTLTDLRLSQSLQQRFVADVSHELRTPLAAMVAVGEGLDSTDPAVRVRATALVREQTRRMAAMVDDLLEMSRFDAGQTSLNLERVDLGELARDVVRTVAPQDDVSVTVHGDVLVDVDASRIHTILRNLIVNACRHGAPPVEVVVDGRADPVVVTVADAGPGVPADLRDSVFDRFVRADASRTSAGDPGGTSTGLGLAIAAENAHLHGAVLKIAGGTRSAFHLRLPRSQAGPHD